MKKTDLNQKLIFIRSACAKHIFCVATTLQPPKLAADCYTQWDKILSECVFHFYWVEIVRFKFVSSSALLKSLVRYSKNFFNRGSKSKLSRSLEFLSAFFKAQQMINTRGGRFSPPPPPRF